MGVRSIRTIDAPKSSKYNCCHQELVPSLPARHVPNPSITWRCPAGEVSIVTNCAFRGKTIHTRVNARRMSQNLESANKADNENNFNIT